MWVMRLEGDQESQPDHVTSDDCPDDRQVEFSSDHGGPADPNNNRQSILNIINERDEGAESNDADDANLHLSPGKQPVAGGMAESRGDLTICGDYAIPGLMIYEQDQQAVSVYNHQNQQSSE